MDKELSALEDWAVEQILEWKDSLELKQKSSGKTPSDLKRALRFGNELVFNPEAYGDMLEKARLEGKSAKEIIQEIRKVETKLLDTKKVLLSDWVHHRTAQRTGGNTFLYMKGDSRREARNILRGEGLFLGNVDENLVSLPGVLHTKKTQGLEKIWYDSLSFDEQRGLYLPKEKGGAGLRIAHETGATAGVISGTALNPGELSPEEGAGFMKKSITQQQAETARAEKLRSTTGFEEQVRKATGEPGAYTDSTKTNLILTPEDAPDVFGKFEAAVDFSGSSARFSTKGAVARGLARSILPSAALGGVSLALGAGDVQAREERAKQDPSFINKFQAGLARTEQAADVAGLVPGPQTVVSEPVGFGAGLTNVAIDVARDPIGTLQAVGGSFKWLVGGGAAKQQRQILNPLSTRL